MKSTVPGRDGREGAAPPRRARARATSATSRTPSSPPRAPRSGTSWSPTGSSSGHSTTADGDAVEALHRGIEAPVVRCDVASAEMIKLAANAALMTRISFINEIANVCEATGADVVKVAEGIGHDRRIGKSFLRAGVGFGGSCFPKDSLALKQLAANSGYHFQVLNAVIEVNELQKRRVIGKLDAASRIAARKAHRAARPRVQAEHRRHARGARLRAGRPAARRGRRRRRVGPGRATRTACTASSRSRTVDEARRRRRRRRARHRMARARRRRLGGGRGARCARPLFVDGRNMLDPETMRAAGLHVRRHRPRGRRRALMEAIVLAGGKAERLGDAAGGRAEVARRGRRPPAARVADRPARRRPASTA